MKLSFGKSKSVESDARIKVLGSGCAKCKKLEENAKAAVKNKGTDDEILHINDMVDIVSYGVMSTPALVIDEKVVATGKILSVKEIEEMI
ncbi:MAG TPA: thioredoxin family protein [Anaerovoracaceae bacterium]|nr:thioredoxin family protein [Anaerovoracaceae bacterium]